MKKTILSIAVIAAAIFAASCQKENLLENNASEENASVFTATIETGAGTKTTVERVDGVEVIYKTKWENTDQISINGVTYTATPDGTDATKATFAKNPDTQTDPTGPFNAYFPANLYNNGTPTLPANVSEEWADGKYNMPMYATSPTTSLSFRNLCGVLKITVTDAQLASVKCITVSSTNCATSGAFNVTDNKAVLTAASNTANTVTVTYTEAVTTVDATGKVFYVAIPAQTYKNLSIAVSDGTTTKVMTTKKDQDIEVVRNTVYPIAFDGQPTTGTAKRTSDIDVNWVQLWAGGPKFAEYNVGAENNNAEDYGGYYNWGMSEVQTSSNYSNYKSGTDPLTGTDDTATNLWGSNWRMPTKAEFENLLSNCNVAWTTVNGKNGCKFTGKGGYASNSVFLPAVGYCYFGSVYDYGYVGYYWSSTPDVSNRAYGLLFYSGSRYVHDEHRSSGYSVRAVLTD